MEPDRDEAPSEALGMLRLAETVGAAGAILLAHSEAQAVRLAGAARTVAGGLDPVHLPAWDCLPYDRASPSHGSMGRRIAAHRAILSGSTRLVIASPEAAVQRLGAGAASLDLLTLRPGDAVDRGALEEALDQFGFNRTDEAEAPGEIALRPTVIDVFPADADRPIRIRLDGDRIDSIERIRAASRRSGRPLDIVEIGPASELAGVLPPADRREGAEHALAEHANAADGEALRSVFELMPEGALLLDDDAEESLLAHLAQIREARDTRVALARSGRSAMPSDDLYLSDEDWRRIRDGRNVALVDWPAAATLPRLVGRAGEASRLVDRAVAEGERVGLSGPRVARALSIDDDVAPLADGTALAASPPGTVALLPDGLGRGFRGDGLLVLAADDVAPPLSGDADIAALFAAPLRAGDTAIHLDHGLARFAGFETIDTGDGPVDCLALDFSGDARKLVSCAEMDRVWRQGGPDETVALDRADGSSWAKRCGDIVRGIEDAAARMVDEAAARRRRTAPSIRPDRRRMARFVAGFPYAPTADQLAAFDAIAADLAGGTPMSRLLCGEAGYGKTEAALRAAAAVALSGGQVAILAPTTVLVRQHAETFRRRFATLGIETASLSRLTSRTEAARIRKRLADGSLAVVVGTQALVGGDVAFRDLALVVVDEEQRFGTEDKARLAAFRDGVHMLSMTATPIPRTLERALAGLEEISVLATPPARRLPVRTEIVDRDEAVIATALRREHERGGQSFVICPRIRDLDEAAAILERLMPELSVVTLHGRMKPDALDAALVGFADGHGDVLLATNIVEAGLDIPRANTLLAFDADRFGLAQLHQIRGRVGRGRQRGHAFLFRSASRSGRAAARLDALAAHDGLGAGFAISGRDLDQRGAGDLLGDEQAGHATLLGLELARHLTALAVRRARGDAVPEEWRPEISLGVPLTIPADYVGDENARIALHARLARPHAVRALLDEVEDRFGPPPDEVRCTLAAAELRQACRRFGVRRLEAGPSGVAADLRDGEAPPIDGLERKGRRLLLRRPTATPLERVAAARHLLRLLASAPPSQRGAADPSSKAKQKRAARPRRAPTAEANVQPPAS